MKDNFSTDSDKYAKYRPTYPNEFYEYLRQLVPRAENAWDCGTGNGQVAQKLASLFTNVYATDISQSQVDNAVKQANIFYSVQPAEKTNFPDHFFDLVIVAQAIHWFDFDKFYTEVRRTARKPAIIIVIGYGLLKVKPEIDRVIGHFYTNIVGSYWDKERKFIDEAYKTIPFPFEEIDAPAFSIKTEFSFDDLTGYLRTWSALKHYIKQNGTDPIDLVINELESAWGRTESIKSIFHYLPELVKFEKAIKKPLINQRLKFGKLYQST